MANQDIPKAVRQMQNRLLARACLTLAALLFATLAAFLLHVALGFAALAISLYLVAREVK